ncbi:MAG: hypothetical protein C3F11_08385 [Methylocystaceae bacterium]|nr:MAG: hypothetical protein C3F11_08385 [Methylocystaceae bacterium]
MGDHEFSCFHLTAREARAVARLMTASPRVVSREKLTKAVYADGPAPKSDRIPSLVCALRKKLAAHGVSIETKRGKGYRLSKAMAERLAAIGAPAGAAQRRNTVQTHAAPEAPVSAVAPAPGRLSTTFIQGGGLRLRERFAGLARRYSLAGVLASIAGSRSPVPGAIDFARGRDGAFEMRN